MLAPKTWIALLAAGSCTACSPALDWREFVPEGSGLSVSFPCRPDRHARAVVLGGAKVQMEMLVCSAGNATYALSFFDVAEPAHVSATLAEWRAAAVANVQGSAPQLVALQIKGMTANDNAVRMSVAGHLPDGTAVQEHAEFFTRGLRLYQAAVIGARPTSQDVESFFGAVRLPG